MISLYSGRQTAHSVSLHFPLFKTWTGSASCTHVYTQLLAGIYYSRTERKRMLLYSTRKTNEIEKNCIVPGCIQGVYSRSLLGLYWLMWVCYNLLDYYFTRALLKAIFQEFNAKKTLKLVYTKHVLIRGKKKLRITAILRNR